jgi:hypothetical protein
LGLVGSLEALVAGGAVSVDNALGHERGETVRRRLTKVLVHPDRVARARVNDAACVPVGGASRGLGTTVDWNVLGASNGGEGIALGVIWQVEGALSIGDNDVVVSVNCGNASIAWISDTLFGDLASGAVQILAINTDVLVNTGFLGEAVGAASSRTHSAFSTGRSSSGSRGSSGSSGAVGGSDGLGSGSGLDCGSGSGRSSASSFASSQGSE